MDTLSDVYKGKGRNKGACVSHSLVVHVCVCGSAVPEMSDVISMDCSEGVLQELSVHDCMLHDDNVATTY
jgi:hypothetical protein